MKYFQLWKEKGLNLGKKTYTTVTMDKNDKNDFIKDQSIKFVNRLIVKKILNIKCYYCLVCD